jgi:hypothetical protein
MTYKSGYWNNIDLTNTSATSNACQSIITGLNRSRGFQEFEDPRFQDNRHMKVVRLSTLRTGRLYSPGIIPGTYFCCGPGISVGTATGYGLDGPGIESRWGCDFFHTRPDRPWGPPSLLHNGYRVFPGGKAAGAWC